MKSFYDERFLLFILSVICVFAMGMMKIYYYQKEFYIILGLVLLAYCYGYFRGIKRL